MSQNGEPLPPGWPRRNEQELPAGSSTSGSDTKRDHNDAEGRGDPDRKRAQDQSSEREKLEQMLISSGDTSTEEKQGIAPAVRLTRKTETDHSGGVIGESSSRTTDADSGVEVSVKSASPVHGEAVRRGVVADDSIASVSYDEIRESCAVARKQNRKVIALVGLAATGKSFLIRRLGEDVLHNDYTYIASKGIPASGEVDIQRTREILRYHFNYVGNPRSPENFDIYDIPGDQFRKMAGQGWIANPEDRESLKLYYAIFAHADALIFIAPAQQVLTREEYIQHGDDLALNKTERELRAREIGMFVQSLEQMAKVIALLKERSVALGFDRAIDEVLALDFQKLQQAVPESSRLAMPALLLLSRADELARRCSPAVRKVFDADPAAELARRARSHFAHLARRFDAFAADFLTAEAGHEVGTLTFNSENPHFGVKDMIDGWLLPAVNVCRRPRWSRFLQSPTIAIGLRRVLDPEFDRIWRG